MKKDTNNIKKKQEEVNMKKKLRNIGVFGLICVLLTSTLLAGANNKDAFGRVKFGNRYFLEGGLEVGMEFENGAVIHIPGLLHADMPLIEPTSSTIYAEPFWNSSFFQSFSTSPYVRLQVAPNTMINAGPSGLQPWGGPLFFPAPNGGDNFSPVPNSQNFFAVTWGSSQFEDYFSWDDDIGEWVFRDDPILLQTLHTSMYPAQGSSPFLLGLQESNISEFWWRLDEHGNYVDFHRDDYTQMVANDRYTVFAKEENGEDLFYDVYADRVSNTGRIHTGSSQTAGFFAVGEHIIELPSKESVDLYLANYDPESNTSLPILPGDSIVGWRVQSLDGRNVTFEAIFAQAVHALVAKTTENVLVGNLFDAEKVELAYTIDDVEQNITWDDLTKKPTGDEKTVQKTGWNTYELAINPTATLQVWGYDYDRLEAIYHGEDVEVGEEYDPNDVSVRVYYTERTDGGATYRVLEQSEYQLSSLLVEKEGVNEFDVTASDLEMETTFVITGVIADVDDTDEEPKTEPKTDESDEEENESVQEEPKTESETETTTKTEAETKAETEPEVESEPKTEQERKPESKEEEPTPTVKEEVSASYAPKTGQEASFWNTPMMCYAFVLGALLAGMRMIWHIFCQRRTR